MDQRQALALARFRNFGMAASLHPDPRFIWGGLDGRCRRPFVESTVVSIGKLYKIPKDWSGLDGGSSREAQMDAGGASVLEGI